MFFQQKIVKFEIIVRDGLEEWRLFRTHEDFLKLHDQIRIEFGGTSNIDLPPPPSKRNLFDMEPNEISFERCRRELEVYLRNLVMNPRILHSASLRVFLEPPSDPKAIRRNEGSLEDVFFLPAPSSTTSLPKILKLRNFSFSVRSESHLSNSLANNSNEKEPPDMKQQHKTVTFELLPDPNTNVNENDSVIIPPLDDDSFTPLYIEHTEVITEDSTSASSTLIPSFSASTTMPSSNVHEGNAARLWKSSVDCRDTPSKSSKKIVDNLSDTTTEDDDKNLYLLQLLIDDIRDHLQWVSLLKLSYEKERLNKNFEFVIEKFNSGKIFATKESLVKEKEALQEILNVEIASTNQTLSAYLTKCLDQVTRSLQWLVEFETDVTNLVNQQVEETLNTDVSFPIDQFEQEAERLVIEYALTRVSESHVLVYQQSSEAFRANLQTIDNNKALLSAKITTFLNNLQRDYESFKAKTQTNSLQLETRIQKIRDYLVANTQLN